MKSRYRVEGTLTDQEPQILHFRSPPLWFTIVHTLLRCNHWRINIDQLIAQDDSLLSPMRDLLHGKIHPGKAVRLFLKLKLFLEVRARVHGLICHVSVAIMLKRYTSLPESSETTPHIIYTVCTWGHDYPHPQGSYSSIS